METTKDKNSRTRILEAATKLFARQGFDGTSIRQICKEASVNICMISYYWGGKQELYQGIINDLIERQSEYARTFIDFETDFTKISKQEQVNQLFLVLDKFIDFFYSGNISKDLLIFLVKEQQNSGFAGSSPAFDYLRKLIAAIFDSDINDKNIVFKTLFIISQINSARILPAFSLSQLGQEDFVQEDINIIRNNVKFYIRALLKEAGINV